VCLIFKIRHPDKELLSVNEGGELKIKGTGWSKSGSSDIKRLNFGLFRKDESSSLTVS
jgi:hypothetical protein